MKPDAVVTALAALAQESRLLLFRSLVKRGPEGYTPGEIIERLGIPAPTLSFHLKTLSAAGLVVARREGRFIFYSASFERMESLMGFLTDQCCSLATGDCSTAACSPSKAPKTRKKAAA